MKPRMNSGDVVQFATRLQDWGRATIARLKRRDWRAWLGVMALLYAVTEFVRAKVDEAATILLVWLFEGFWGLIGQPMGLGGLGLLVLLAILVVSAWWETRPRLRPKDIAEPQLSDEDRRLVQDLRTIWNRHGESAVKSFQSVLGDTATSLKRQAYWGVLLNPIIRDLNQGEVDMTKAVASDSKLSLGEVRDKFNQLYSSYVKAMEWVAKLEAHGDVRIEGEILAQLQRWKRFHYDFYEKLQDLHQVPEHHRSLRIFVNYPDDATFAAFLKAAETKPPE